MTEILKYQLFAQQLLRKAKMRYHLVFLILSIVLVKETALARRNRGRRRYVPRGSWTLRDIDSFNLRSAMPFRRGPSGMKARPNNRPPPISMNVYGGRPGAPGVRTPSGISSVRYVPERTDSSNINFGNGKPPKNLGLDNYFFVNGASPNPDLSGKQKPFNRLNMEERLNIALVSKTFFFG